MQHKCEMYKMSNEHSKQLNTKKTPVNLKPSNGKFLFQTAGDQQNYLRSLKGPNFPSGGAPAPIVQLRRRPPNVLARSG